MVFSLFSRKPRAPDPTTTTTASSSVSTVHHQQQLRTPSPSTESASIGKAHFAFSPPKGSPSGPEPPITPSPPRHPDINDLGLVTDPSALHALILSIPAKSLQEYILNHLIPPPRGLSYTPTSSSSHLQQPPIYPPSAATLTHLTSFFSSLTPPPRLHCIRCHKSFYDVENDYHSCLVAHDDDSAEVERVGGGYETLWKCCDQTVEGDGDMGPPEGWCYEGKHTTDTKRARFRADSTVHDDKLVSCERLRCHEPPREHADSDGSSVHSSPRQRKAPTRKRRTPSPHKEGVAHSGGGDTDADEAKSAGTSSKSRRTKSTARAKKPSSPIQRPDGQQNLQTREEEEDEDDDARSAGTSTGKRRAPAPSATSSKPPPRKKKRARKTGDEAAFKPNAEEEEQTSEDAMEVDFNDIKSTTVSRRKSRPKQARKSLGGDPSGPGDVSSSKLAPQTVHKKGSMSFSANAHPLNASAQETGISDRGDARANAGGVVGSMKPKMSKRAKALSEVVSSSVDWER